MNHEVVLLYYFYYWSVCIWWRTARTWCSIQLLLSRLWIYRYLTSNFNPLLLWALSVADEQGNNGSFHKWCIKWNGTAGKCLIFVANKLLNNKLVSCHPLNKDKGCSSSPVVKVKKQTKSKISTINCTLLFSIWTNCLVYFQLGANLIRASWFTKCKATYWCRQRIYSKVMIVFSAN